MAKQRQWRAPGISQATQRFATQASAPRPTTLPHQGTSQQHRGVDTSRTFASSGSGRPARQQGTSFGGTTISAEQAALLEGLGFTSQNDQRTHSTPSATPPASSGNATPTAALVRRQGAASWYEAHDATAMTRIVIDTTTTPVTNSARSFAQHSATSLPPDQTKTLLIIRIPASMLHSSEDAQTPPSETQREGFTSPMPLQPLSEHAPPNDDAPPSTSHAFPSLAPTSSASSLHALSPYPSASSVSTSVDLSNTGPVTRALASESDDDDSGDRAHKRQRLHPPVPIVKGRLSNTFKGTACTGASMRIGDLRRQAISRAAR